MAIRSRNISSMRRRQLGRYVRANLLITLGAMILFGPFLMPAIAADKTNQIGESSPPARHVEERPFGGPPPKYRGQTPSQAIQYGKRCRIQRQTCQLVRQLELGDTCTCPGDLGAKGTVVK